MVRYLLRLTTCSLVFSCIPAVSVAQNSVGEVDVNALVWKLDSGSCANPGALWTQTSGPTVPVLINNGADSSVRVGEHGDYEFELSCCSANGNGSGDRVQALMSSPDRIGFGAATTGGSAASSFTVVTSLKDDGEGSLREAMKQDGPLWIIFDESIHGGTINLRSSINTHTSDITLDGAGADITLRPISGGEFPLLQFRGGNGIIHGITIDLNQTRSTGLGLKEGKNYWVDHITVSGAIYDDGLTLTQQNRGKDSSTEITVSNYHVYDTNYGILGGGGKLDSYVPYNVTIHSSNLSARDRNPRIVNNGFAHFFNNYVHSHTYSGASADTDSVLVAENNVFSARDANNPKVSLVGRSTTGGVDGTVYEGGNLFLHEASSSGNVRGLSQMPFTIPYSYTLMDVEDVAEHVLSNAGAANATTHISGGGSCETIVETFSYWE